MKSGRKKNNMYGYTRYLTAVLITLLFLGIFLVNNNASADGSCQDFKVLVTNDEGMQFQDCWKICMDGDFGTMDTFLIEACILARGNMGSDMRHSVSMCNFGEYACSINFYGGNTSLTADCMGAEGGGCMNCHARGVAGCK